MAGEGCLADDRHLSPHEATGWRAIGMLLIGITSFEEQRRQRSRSRVVQGRMDHYLVQVFTASTPHSDIGGLARSAGAGDIRILDLAQPPTSPPQTDATLSVMIPRLVLDKAAGSRHLHGIVLMAGSPMTSLLIAYIEALYALEAPLLDMQASAAQESVVTLLSAALQSRVPNGAGHATSRGAGLRQRVVDFMSRNLCLLELSPDFLCRRFNVSRAHLYRAFASSGGVAKVLRDMRLDEVYRELTQVTRDSRSITDLAWSLGFSSSNQLLRSFRARFGITPSEARAGMAVSVE